MKLYEEFKQYESLWEDGFHAAEECGTSSIEVGLDGWQGKKLLNKAGIPHKEAYKELLRVLKSVANKDLTELFISWVADRRQPGDKAADAIVIVDGLQELIDNGKDIEEAEKNGYDFRVPANRLVLPCAYDAADLGLPEDAYDVIEAELTPIDKRGALKYAVSFMNDQASVFYIGSKEDCQRVAKVAATTYFAKKNGGVTVARYHDGASTLKEAVPTTIDWDYRDGWTYGTAPTEVYALMATKNSRSSSDPVFIYYDLNGIGGYFEAADDITDIDNEYSFYETVAQAEEAARAAYNQGEIAGWVGPIKIVKITNFNAAYYKPHKNTPKYSVVKAV